MKRLMITGVSFALAFGLISQASASLLVYEGFNYTAGQSLLGQNGGTGFVEPWLTNSTPNDPAVGLGASIVAGSLTYKDSKGNQLVTSGGKLDVNGAFGGNAQPNRYFSVTNGADGTTAWLSFVGVRLGPATNNTSQPLNPYPRAGNVAFYSNTTEMITLGNSTAATNNTWALIPRGSLANIQPTTSIYSNVSLVVMRIDYLAGNDNAYLWVNPVLGTEPLIANANASSLGAFTFDFNRIRPYAGNFDSANSRPPAEIQMDEFRLGTSFLDVTPYVAVPEPSVVALLLLGAGLLVWRWKRR